MPTSPASRTSELAGAGHRLVPVLLESELALAADERVAAERGGERRRPRDRGDLVGDGRPRTPRGGRLAAQEPLVHGHRRRAGGCPSSSRSRMRSSSKTRNASAGFPAASWTSMSRRWADSRNGIAAIAARAACSAGPSSRPALARPASASTSSAHAHGLQFAPLLGHPGPSQSGRKVCRSVASTSTGRSGRARPVVGVDRRLGLGGGRRREASMSTSIVPGGRHAAQSGPPARRRRARGAAWRAARTGRCRPRPAGARATAGRSALLGRSPGRG